MSRLCHHLTGDPVYVVCTFNNLEPFQTMQLQSSSKVIHPVSTQVHPLGITLQSLVFENHNGRLKNWIVLSLGTTYKPR